MGFGCSINRHSSEQKYYGNGLPNIDG